jgi:COPI associated protein
MYGATSTTYQGNGNGNNGNGNSKNSMTEAFTRHIAAAFSKEGLEAAGQFTKEKASELKREAQDGDNSLRFLALVGGMACVVVGLLELVTRFMRLDIVGAMIDAYIILLGVLVVLLEGKKMFLSAGVVEKIHKYALFLQFVWGRGAVYFICGTLQLYQLDLLNLIVGCYMCFVGGLYIVVGNRTATKLKALRKTIYSEHDLRTKYVQADIEGDGLNLQQFRGLCVSLGLDLTRRETEAAFQHIQSKSLSSSSSAQQKQQQNGLPSNYTDVKLTYEDFQRWWSSTDAEDVIDESAVNFV